jgi:glycosyltransferase involved in cell wall biosynthesis
LSATFSIIIPTYNRVELIRPTLESVLAQTIGEWECIVVDDGSTDHTAEVINSYTEKDDRFRYIYQENAERSAARNNGIRHAKGEWICFLDSDDLFLDSYLQQLKEWIAQNSEQKGLYVHQMVVKDLQGKSYVTQDQLNDSTSSTYLYTHPFTPSRICVHRSILETFQFDEDIIIFEDRLLWMRIALLYPLFISELPGVIYMVHDENSVNLNSTGAVKTYAGVKKGYKRYPEVFEKIPKKIHKDMMSRLQTNIGYYHYLNHRKSKSLYWFLSAIFTCPRHHQTKMRLHHILCVISRRKIQLN